MLHVFMTLYSLLISSSGHDKRGQHDENKPSEFQKNWGRLLLRMTQGLLFLWCVVFGIVCVAETSQVNISLAQQQMKLAQAEFDSLQLTLRAAQQARVSTMEQINEEGVLPKHLSSAQQEIEQINAMTARLSVLMLNAKQAIAVTQSQLAVLTRHVRHSAYSPKNRAHTEIKSWQARQQRLQQQLRWQEEDVATLQRAQALAQMSLRGLTQWQHTLQVRYAAQQQQQAEQGYIVTLTQLRGERQRLESALVQLQHQMIASAHPVTASVDHSAAQSVGATEQRSDHDARVASLSTNITTWQNQLMAIEEKLYLNRLSAFILQIEAQRQSLDLINPMDYTVRALQSRLVHANELMKQLTTMQTLTQEKYQVLSQHRDAFAILTIRSDNFLSRLIKPNDYQTLLKTYQKQRQALQTLTKQVIQDKTHLSRALTAKLAARQSLPGWSLPAWRELGHQMLSILPMLGHNLGDIQHRLRNQVSQLSALNRYFVVLVGCFWLLAWYGMRQGGMRLATQLGHCTQRFASQVLRVMVTVVRRNLTALFILAALLSIHLFLLVDVRLWLSIGLVVLIYQSAVILARLWLMEREDDVAGKDVRLYRGLRWVFGIGGLLALLMVVTHVLPVSIAVKSLFNKMFMLLLMILSFLLFKAWSILPILLRPVLSVKRKYIFTVIRLVCWLIPISLLSTAVIGLLGYVDLAWQIGGYQLIFLAVSTLYMVVRGLLMDVTESIYNLVVKHVKSGWFWGSAFIRPLDRLLRVLLFLFTITILLHCYGLDTNPAFLKWVQQAINRPLIVLVGNPITLKFIIGLCLFIVFLCWMAKWSREFSFRWLYRHSKDIGIRHSLSVFTQYAIVIIGVIIGLKISGVDLRGFTVVAAAFVAGIGFGLRDLVSNFVSGMMLLIERPFRKGDTISLGVYEGEVMSTGMRSMTLRTWDHMDVIVPNADMFNKPFVNWTHQDGMIRTVIKINMNRDDDPHAVSDIIFSVLKEISGVVSDPVPEVLLKEISESNIELEVRYYINLYTHTSRSRMRSEVLFKIWDAFHKAGVRAPHPRYDVRLLPKEQAS